ncbi:MAG TPA: ComEC/Rec2 family competence protein, partial [Draconibacterium sp.]|nr:ComEC/Rec2 family competence protein [Draconibacterium sp.]
LFEVGFQLSYAAVFGIVYLQPKFVKLLTIKNKVGHFFWMLLTVSIAAQITTFPITLYYFNQFPTYFWLANLMVIPAVSILIPLGLALLIFAKIPLLSAIISFIINYLIYGIYIVLKYIEQLPFSVFHESVQNIQLIFISGLLLSILFLLKKPGMRFIKMGLTCIFLLIVFSSFIKLNQMGKKEIIVYNYPGNTILQLIDGKENFVLSEKQITEDDYSEDLLNQTNIKLHLKKPIYVTPSDIIMNQHLLSEGGIVIFGDQTILFEQPITTVPENYSVNFAINPVVSNKEEWERLGNTSVILNKSYFHENSNVPLHLFMVPREGAFLKKW